MGSKKKFSRNKKKAFVICGYNYESTENIIKNYHQNIFNKECEIFQNKKTTSNTNAIEFFTEELGENHLNYLKLIGVSEDTARKFALKARYNYILYPQMNQGKVLGYKGISITKDECTGKSKQFFENYTAPVFHASNIKQGKHIIFTEGEKDCLRLSEEITSNSLDDMYIPITITTGANTIPDDIAHIVLSLKPSNISIIYDNDNAGESGALKLAKIITDVFEKVTIYSFPPESKSGYDITDFFNEGKKLADLFQLKTKILEKEKKIIESIYPQYQIDYNSFIQTLCPDKILFTGYEEVDTQCPIVAGENTIIVGRTGKGKTILGINFVNKILHNNEGSKVIVFSLELQKKSFLQRLLSAEYNIELQKIKSGFINDDYNIAAKQKAQYIQYAKEYIRNYENRLMIIDDINSVQQINVVLDNLSKNLNYIPDYILIDYANILNFQNAFDITKHVQISTWMKFLAKEKNIHVQAICQANRATKDNDDGYAKTENLADSDQYSRDAFIVYSIKTSIDSDIYFINPTKNRNGKPEEEIQLRWDAKSGKITSNNSTESNVITL